MDHLLHEGTGSFGAALTGFLLEPGEWAAGFDRPECLAALEDAVDLEDLWVARKLDSDV
jgi:hypothetical protein